MATKDPKQVEALEKAAAKATKAERARVSAALRSLEKPEDLTVRQWATAKQAVKAAISAD